MVNKLLLPVAIIIAALILAFSNRYEYLIPPGEGSALLVRTDRRGYYYPCYELLRGIDVEKIPARIKESLCQ